MTGDEPARSRRTRPQEIDAAIRDLDLCIKRIHALIPRVDAAIDRRTTSARPKARPRVVYGGGPSAFTPRPAERLIRPSGVVSPLIVATDLALAGCSIEQIRTRVQDFDRLAVDKALEEMFE